MEKTINQDNLNATLRFLDKQGEAALEQLKHTDPEQGKKLEQLGVLLNNEDFRNQFAACPDKQEAVKLFAENGLALTETDIEVLVAQIYSVARKLLDNDGALSEEDLEQIAGGGWLGGLVGAAGGAVVLGGVTFIANLIAPGIGSVVMMAVCGAFICGMAGVNTKY